MPARTEARTDWTRAGVMGLGLSGCAAAGLLAGRGVEVIALDDRSREELPDRVAGLERGGVVVRAGRDAGAREDAFAGCEVVIASPGVPPKTAPLAGAVQRGIPVLAEVELASRYLRGVLIGITGSNGKSTVTTLTGRMLQEAGLRATVCGNIGTPLAECAEADLALSEEVARGVHYVVELSSFQLEGCDTLRPRVAVLLNLSPDHQDRYARTGDYYTAKGRLFMNQTPDDLAIVNADDPEVMRLARNTAARRFPFSSRVALEEGALLSDDVLILRRGAGDEALMPADRIPLAGRHNIENVLAASAAAASCGAGLASIAAAVAAVRPLPHRLEPVGRVDGVDYVNDSKATNVGATIRALESFEAPVVLLLGGYDKGGDFTSLREALGRPGAVRALVTFGRAGDAIGAVVRPMVASHGGTVFPVLRAGALAEAVAAARTAARPGDVVLLAPGCASFDAYRNFEERGADFARMVRDMARSAGGVR